MTEEPRLTAGLLQQADRDGLTPLDVGDELLRRHRMQIEMREAVVAQLEAAVDPALQQRHAPVVERPVEIQLVLVDEADRGYCMTAQRRQQIARHVLGPLR